MYKYPHAIDNVYLAGVDDIHSLSENQELEIGSDLKLRVFHTPGHSEDSVCLHLPEENALFAGDTILGGSSGDMEDYGCYMKSLQRLLKLAPDTVYTGHGIVEKTEVIARYLRHREIREAQVLGELRWFGERLQILEQAGVEEEVILPKPSTIAEVKRSCTEEETREEERKWISVEMLTRKVYAKENILHQPALVASAEKIVRGILVKLEAEGKAETMGDDRWRPAL